MRVSDFKLFTLLRTLLAFVYRCSCSDRLGGIRDRTLDTFRHSTLNNGGTASASEGSTVGYVEGEAACWTTQDVLSLVHRGSHVYHQLRNKWCVLKMLLACKQI